MKQKIKITRDALESAMDELLQSRFRNYLYTHKSSAIGHEPIIQRFPDSIEVEVDVPEQRIYGRSEAEDLIPLQMIADVKTSIEIDLGARITALERRVEKLEGKL